MSSAARRRISPAEYLSRERSAETKSEYYAGEMFAMAGASRRHNLVVMNAGADLRSQLRTRPCEVYPSDMRVKITATGLYTYPDVVVVCGEPEFEDEHQDTLLNPTALLEVLSRSTETYDRGKKFGHYRRLESLQEYVLISQDEPRVEKYVRQPGGHWLLSEAVGLEATIQVPSIQCEMRLSEIYEKVRFDEPEEATDLPRRESR